MVSTPLVLEAVRKCSVCDMEANLIFKDALSINLTDDEIYYMVDIINVY